jgi:hypothetical protein
MEQHEMPEPLSAIQQKVDELFTYHAYSAEQTERSGKIRHAAKQLAHAILDNTRPCADQSDAIRKVREAVMTANAAIALEGK